MGAIGSQFRKEISSEELHYICRRGLARNRKEWTPNEVKLVQLYFPDRQMLERTLPSRTWQAIRFRAGLLGLRKKQHRWLASELSLLRRMWIAGASRAAIIDALPRYSWDQIVSQARGRKFARPPKAPSSSGHTVIDQIKQRARSLNMSMRDVDALAGSGQYFYSAAWLSKKQPCSKHVVKAIIALDGDVHAVWREQ